MNMGSAFHVAWFLTANRLRWPSALLVRWGQFALQGAVFGAVIAQLVEGVPHFQSYYVVGLLAIAMYNTGMLAGSELLSDAQYGVEDYFLALPISRRILYSGRILGAGLMGLLFVGPPALAVLVLTGQWNLPVALYLILLIFGISAGLAGVGMAFAAAFRQYEAFLMVSSFVDAFVIRLSAALYPLAAMPMLYAAIAVYNPVSHIAWLLQPLFAIAPPEVSSLGSVLLIAWIIVALISGGLVFQYRLEGRRHLL
jgi:ABC-type polysaccharide/polyol phosphate export permease